MTEFTGSTRLRRAIENQASAGEACFTLPIGEAAAICDECEDELARLSWADGVPAPVDADGTVVPLDTKVMYTHMGKKIELSEFNLFHSVLSGGFVWRTIRNTGHGVNDLRLSCLHLRRPDSWELLEEDVNLGCRDYCERYRLEECEYNVRAHMLERAKALAERGAKEADRD